MGADGAHGRRIAGWAALVCAVTIVLAIGAPLIGRGLLIGTDIIKTVPPWSAETPTSFVYRHGPINDTIDSGAPARDAIRDTLVENLRLPLWDPYPNGGTPLGSVPNSGVLAPISWPILLLGVGNGVAWAALARLTVAAVGMFLLLRWLGLGRFAAVCGGLVYCTSGFLIVWNNWPQADMAAMFPLFFLTADRVRARRTLLDVLALAAVVAAMLLEGYLPLLLAVGCFLALFLLIRWWEESRGSEPERPPLRSRLGTALVPALMLAGGVALGVALVAFLLLPFTRGLDAYDLSYRQHNSVRVFAPSGLLTSMFPWAQGSPAHPETLEVLNPQSRRFTVNFVEQFVFLGAAAVVMAGWAIVAGRPRRVSRGVFAFCAVGVASLVLMLFGRQPGRIPDLGQAIADGVYALPGLGQVPIARFVAILLFLATMLAAFGIERIADPEHRRLRIDGWFALRVGGLVAFLAYAGYRPLRNQLTLLTDGRSTDFWGTTLRHAAGQREWILRNSVVPVLILVAALVVIAIAWRGRGAWRTAALVVLPVLLAVEGLLVTAQMLPRVDESDYFPDTELIRYLQANQGHERVAPAGRSMLYYATNNMYGIRSVAGHSMTEAEWQQLLFGTRPEYQQMLQSRLGQGEAVARAPILDRLAARLFVAMPDAVPFGTPEAAPPAVGTITIGNGKVGTATLPAGPLRAVQVEVVGPTRYRGDLVFLDATVLTTDGKVLARGSRRLQDQKKTTTIYVPLAGERIAPGTPHRLEVRLRSDRRDTAALAATADGSVRVGLTRPADDGLRLVHADAGGVVYRRLLALPRFRWATQTRTIRDRVKTYLALYEGVDPDTVVLGEPARRPSGKPADIEVIRDSRDKIELRVDAEGSGYLVVADAIQSGWNGRLDGASVPLRRADHALVAIYVPKGVHTIELVAHPEGWRAGILISLVAVVVFVGLIVLVVVRRRRAMRRDGEPAPAPTLAGADDGG